MHALARNRSLVEPGHRFSLIWQEALECQATHAALLLALDGVALEQLVNLCAPCQVAMQEFPPKLVLGGSVRALPAAREAAAAWLAEHQETLRALQVPSEVFALLKQRLATLLDASLQRSGVRMNLRPDSSMLEITGPEKFVGKALAAAEAFVRQHARREEAISMSAEDFGLVAILRTRNLFEGVELVPMRSENRVLVKGTDEAVGKAKARLEDLLAEAERCAVQQPLNGAQLDKLNRVSGRDREPLLRKLEQSYECALFADRSTMSLSLRGRGEAVVRMQEALATELDIDEHERHVAVQMIPILIGKGGTTIKRLQQESGATFDLERSSGRVRVFGRASAVQKAQVMLDGLTEEFGAIREIEVQQRQIALVIGRGGSTIKTLQAESGANIEIRKDDCVVRVKGSQAAVEDAVQRIQTLLGSAQPASSGAAQRPNGAPPPGLRQPPRSGPPPGPPPGLVPQQ